MIEMNARMKRYSCSYFMDLSPSASPQLPLKGDIWSQMPPLGDSWTGTCQMRKGHRTQRHNNQMEWNRRRHTVTEIPSSASEFAGCQTPGNNAQMSLRYDKPLAINIPHNEPLGTTKPVDYSGGEQTLGILKQNQGNQSTFSEASTKPEFKNVQPPTFVNTAFNSLKQSHPLGWSHVSAFVPPSHWKRPDVSKLYQNDQIIPPMNTPSSNDVQNLGNPVTNEMRNPRIQPWDHKNNEQLPRTPTWGHENSEDLPRPITRRKKPVVQRRHTVDLVPDQREITLGSTGGGGTRYQLSQNMSRDRSGVTSRLPPPERTANVTQISFDAMLGIIQLSNSSSNQTSKDTDPVETSKTSFTDILRIDEESLLPPVNEKTRQGPYGQEQATKVHAMPYPGRTSGYSKGRPSTSAHGPCNPPQYGIPPMPTISEDPFNNRNAANEDVSQNMSTGAAPSAAERWNQHVISNSLETNQTLNKHGLNTPYQPQKHQRPYRTRKQPSLENMLGVTSLSSGDNSFNAIIQPYSSSSTVKHNTSPSFGERIDSLTKKWTNMQQEVAYELSPNRKKGTKKLSNQKSHDVTQLPDNPYNSNNFLSVNLSSNNGNANPYNNGSLNPYNNAVVTNTKNANESKPKLQAQRKHLASFRLSGLTPACIYITLPQVRYFHILYFL